MANDAEVHQDKTYESAKVQKLDGKLKTDQRSAHEPPDIQNRSVNTGERVIVRPDNFGQVHLHNTEQCLENTYRNSCDCNIPLRVVHVFSEGGNGVEADIGQRSNACPEHHGAQFESCRVVYRMRNDQPTPTMRCGDEMSRKDNKKDRGKTQTHHHDVVSPSRHLDATNVNQ